MKNWFVTCATLTGILFITKYVITDIPVMFCLAPILIWLTVVITMYAFIFIFVIFMAKSYPKGMMEFKRIMEEEPEKLQDTDFTINLLRDIRDGKYDD